jgi:hypothetical protein
MKWAKPAPADSRNSRPLAPALSGGTRRLLITIPARLPTWNWILSARLRKRLACKLALHALLSACIASAIGSRTPMESAQNGPSIASLRQAYCRTMGQGSSRKSGSARRRFPGAKKSGRKS